MAFDKVQHKRLLKKVWAYGIRDKVHGWTSDFLLNRKQQVLVNGVKSNQSEITSGIPQGTVLGPILLYINDLSDVIPVYNRLFADDSKLYNGIDSVQDIKNLQKGLDEAVKWGEDWKMKYIVNKCKHLHVGKNKYNSEYTMIKDNEISQVELVQSEKDLGVIIDSNLKFSEHINNKIKIANRNVGLIFRSFSYMDKDMFMSLYKSVVRPHLEYASCTWAPVYKRDCIALENVQRRATKMVPCLRNLPHSERLKKIGLPSLEYRRQRADVIQVLKFLHEYEDVDKSKLFIMASTRSTRGNSLKLFKSHSRLVVRNNFFSNRVVNVWNSLPDNIVTAPSINSFKSQLNNFWKHIPIKFDPSCYEPGRNRCEVEENVQKHHQRQSLPT